jgi:hypothetical protein
MENIHSFFGFKNCHIKLLQKYDGRDKILQEHYIHINEENITFYYKNVEKINLVFDKINIEGDKIFLKVENSNEKSFFDKIFSFLIEYFETITIRKWIEGHYTCDLLSNKDNILLCNLGILIDEDDFEKILRE